MIPILLGVFGGALAVFGAALYGAARVAIPNNTCYYCPLRAVAMYRARCGAKSATKYACTDHTNLAATVIRDWTLRHADC